LKTIVAAFCVAGCLMTAAGAEETPGPGKLLVATEDIGGPVFAESVILLLSYDKSGAIGLVVNRPTDVMLTELLEDASQFKWYADELFWGGPVEMHTVRALVKSDTPPGDSQRIFDSVHIVRVEEDQLKTFISEDSLRLFMGYAGWAPGQLDSELAKGSWRVVVATEGAVFADEPKDVWGTLSLPPSLSVWLR